MTLTEFTFSLKNARYVSEKWVLLLQHLLPLKEKKKTDIRYFVSVDFHFICAPPIFAILDIVLEYSIKCVEYIPNTIFFTILLNIKKLSFQKVAIFPISEGINY